MEAEVLNPSNGCQPDEADRQLTRGISFSKELISFSLYGKIPRKSKRPWNEALSSKIAEVQDSFKNIPSMLYFSPSSVTFDGIGVYAAETLPKGTMLGPYFGKAVHKEHTEEETHEWLWEVYQDSSLAYFIDASDPKYGNWMNFIQCARNQREQNLKALQYNGCLYFESVRDVAVGEELLVWYDDLQYDIYMGIPVGFRGKAGSSRSSSMTESYPNSRPSSDNSEEMFLSSCPSTSSLHPITGSRLSDTSSASTDDSGISVSFEHNTGSGGPSSIPGGGPLETFAPSESGSGMMFPSVTTTNQSEVTSASYPPGHQVSVARCVEPPPVQLPVVLADNLQQKISELKAATVAGPRFGVGPVSLPVTTVGVEFGRDSPVWTSISASGYNVVAPGLSAISKLPQPPQLGSRELLTAWGPTAINPPGTSGLAQGASGGGGSGKTCSLLYNMFVKTVDGTRWQCVECKKLFNSQGSLRAHARIHTGERPYQCQYCFRTFCQASTLRSHERLHTGEKPYKCEHCGRAFTQSAGLRSHLKTHRYDA